MNKIELYINPSKHRLNANQYGSYNFFLNITTGGPGFHSKFSFEIKPIESEQRYTSVIIDFAESLHRFETIIKQRFIYEAFKNGIEKFVKNIRKNGYFLSNSIRILITQYEPHPVDSKPICNELCIERALNHIYLGTELDKRTVFEIKYLEYDTIQFSVLDSDGIKINNSKIQWGTPINDFIKKLSIESSVNQAGSKIKHFTGSKSLKYSNVISNKAYHFEVGFDNEDKFIELSSQIGFEFNFRGLDLKYSQSMKSVGENSELQQIQFQKDTKGNYSNKKLGIVLSESAYENNKFGKGNLEYIYITRPKEPADNKL